MQGPRDVVLKILLIWVTLLTSVLVWLPIVRGLSNGDAYQWSLVDGIGGRGIGGDYWMLLVALVYVLALEIAGRRGPRVLFPVLLLPLLIAFNAAVLYAAWKAPEALRFEGATFGIDVSLAQVLPALFTLVTLLAIGWTVWRRSHGGFAREWPPCAQRNTQILSLAAVMLAVEFSAFRFGGAAGNQVGVMLTLAQWFVLNTGFNRFTPATGTSP